MGCSMSHMARRSFAEQVEDFHVRIRSMERSGGMENNRAAQSGPLLVQFNDESMCPPQLQRGVSLLSNSVVLDVGFF